MIGPPLPPENRKKKNKGGREKCPRNNLLQSETGTILFFSRPETGPPHNDVSVMG